MGDFPRTQASSEPRPWPRNETVAPAWLVAVLRKLAARFRRRCAPRVTELVALVGDDPRTANFG